MICSFSTVYPEGRAIEGECGNTPCYVRCLERSTKISESSYYSKRKANMV
jgi:hypothetical protein